MVMLPSAFFRGKPQAGINKTQIEARLFGLSYCGIVHGLHVKQSVGAASYVKRPNQTDRIEPRADRLCDGTRCA